MFRLILAKELKEILSSTKFAVTFGVCSVLIVLAFFLGARGYHVGRAQYDAARAEARRQMEGETDWLNVSPTVFLPPQPLAYLVPGISNDIGRSTEIRGRGGFRSEGSRFGDEPLLALFRFVDLEFTFQVVLSLLAILFAYDAVCGERERGTLRLTFSQPVPRGTYILGKIGGSLLGLTVPLLIPLAAGALIFQLMGVPMSGADWGRLGLIILAGMLFIGAILGLSVLVSSMTRRSATSFVLLLSLWVFGVLIVPRASVLLAARSVDVPSTDNVLSQRSRLWAQLWREDQETINRFMRDQMDIPEDAEDPQAAMQAAVAAFNEKFDELAEQRQRKIAALDARLAEERANRQHWQQRLALGLARVSPASTFSLASSELAGTSLELPEYYRDRLGAYQERFAAFQQEKTGRSSGGIRMVVKMGNEEEEEPGPIDLAELPEFVFEPQPVRKVLQGSLLDLSLLAFFNLLFFAGAFVSFLRYDVR
ncbi:MAG: ABC transporter permease [Acidobacteriota bacterium]|jgi:ABC-type transport system involved in multi-copper enzyme maturation permease subunit